MKYIVVSINTKNTNPEALQELLNELYERNGVRLVAIDQNGYYVFEDVKGVNDGKSNC